MRKASRAVGSAQPHDALVKWTFSQREHAIGLLKAALPAEVVAAVDWSTVRVDKDSFVDPALRSRYSDLIISARMGRERVYFYTIIEHQRDVEALMVFRVLQYMTRLWERIVLDHPTAKTLPPIVPLLIHNSARGWTAATAFQDIIAGEGPARAVLERHIPRFEVRLIDVSEGRASRLVEQALTALAKVVMWCLSVADDDERFAREIEHIGELIDEVITAPDGRAALRILLRYLAATHVRMRAEKVGELLMKAASPPAQEVIVTFLEEIERRGERRGVRKGRAQALLDLLTARFGPLSPVVSARILAANDTTLAEWTVRVLTAPTLEAVLEGRQAAPPPRRATRKRAPRG